MATNVLFDVQAGRLRELDQEPAETIRGKQISLRRERGFVSADGDLYVETRDGLAGARGLTLALVLEVLAVACVWVAWHWLH